MYYNIISSINCFINRIPHYKQLAVCNIAYLLYNDKDMNVVVTESAGFVGRNQVENLKYIRDGKEKLYRT